MPPIHTPDALTLSPQDRLRLADDIARIVARTLEERGIVGPVSPEAVSYDTAGVMVELSGRTVRKMADRGELTRVQVGDGSPRIRVASIRTYLSRQEAQSGNGRAQG